MSAKPTRTKILLRAAGAVALMAALASVAWAQMRAKPDEDCAVDAGSGPKSCCVAVPQSRAKAFTAPSAPVPTPRSNSVDE